MKIHIYIRYSSVFGENLHLRLWNKKGTEQMEMPLTYQNEQFWHLELEDDDLPFLPTLKYDCFKNTINGVTEFLFTGRMVDLRKHKGDKLDIIDEIPLPERSSILYSKPFRTLLERGSTTVKKPADKNFNVVFKAGLPPLPDGKAMCITGSGDKLHNWSASNPLMMYKKDGFWTAKLNLGKEKSIEYKYAIYDLKSGKIETYEEGNNRILHTAGKKGQTIVHQYPKLEPIPFKGTGINVHLMSLRSESGWGTGSFSDLITLSEWASSAGFKLIQLLPVNDTIVNGTPEDSYPYAAISAFALHPYLLDVKKLVLQTGAVITEALEQEAIELNKSEHIDFERLYTNRMAILRLLYESGKNVFKDDFAWFDFFDLNREWLVPYAAFCCLRDQYKTADFRQWNEDAVFDENRVQKMAEPDSLVYDDMAFYYFIQFHLHLQFKEAVYHTHKNEMVLKGDLPIGVGRFSVETWMYPHLFKMDQQCGAPPDAFSAGGQNWGFPTYNWDTMQQEDYRWWRNRLEYMSVYFDATRIDHVIGLFRMWSIPYGNKTGELGIFDPVIGYTKEELESNGIHLDEQRLCDPFINDAILHFYFHGEKSRIEETYLENNRFKPEFDNQAKLDAYLESANESLKAPLKQLMTNVIMIKKGSHFHFRMNMQQTPSYQSLPEDQKHLLDKLYNDYFGERQENIWTTSGKSILEMMKSATQMMLCAEDLGMVPSMVPGVLKENEILSLYIERMPHQLHQRFGDLLQAPYLSVVTPSTHDMETLASWWEHHPEEALLYFHEILKGEGNVPNRLTSKIGKEIIKRHLNVHAMWVVFLLQDILIADKSLIREDVIKDRINDPGNDDHVWDYRFHISMEQLEDHRHLAEMLRDKIFKSGRL